MKDARSDLLQAKISSDKEKNLIKGKNIWIRKLNEFSEIVQTVNKQIDKLNMIVPTLRQQLFHFDAEQEVNQVLASFADNKEHSKSREFDKFNLDQMDKTTTLGDVWKELKSLFRS